MHTLRLRSVCFAIIFSSRAYIFDAVPPRVADHSAVNMRQSLVARARLHADAFIDKPTTLLLIYVQCMNIENIYLLQPTVLDSRIIEALKSGGLQSLKYSLCGPQSQLLALSHVLL